MSFSVEEIRHLYDFRSHFLKVNRFRLHYLDEGDGEPVVMLHGNPTWSFMYRHLARCLRDRYRLVIPDHIGCGLSDKPAPCDYPYRFGDRVSDLEHLLDHLKLTSGLTLAVHDWGGLIGFALACRFPERIRRLIVFNTAAFLLRDPTSLHWSIRICRTSKMAAYAVQRFNLFVRLAGYLGPAKAMPREIREAYAAPYNSWQNRIAVLRFVQDIPLQPQDPSYSLLEETEKNLHKLLDKSMLICWGQKDFVFNDVFLQEWIQRFPQAQVQRFPDAGHFVLEDAGEAIARSVREFLDTNPP